MKFSLKAKTIMIITAVAVFISIVSILCFRYGLTRIIIKLYLEKCEGLGYTVANTIDSDKLQSIRDKVLEIYNASDNRVSNEYWDESEWEDYISQYSDIQKTYEFVSMQRWLRQIQNDNHVDCIYIIYSDTENKDVVYIVDASYEENCPPGSFDHYTETDYAVLENPEQGFPVEITNTSEYGWLMAVGKPIYNDVGDIICYVGVDETMNEIMGLRNRIVLYITITMCFVSAIFVFICILLVDRFVVKPINTLSNASVDYCKENKSNVHHQFADLKINTGDEIETLANSMIKMEEDINDYVHNLIAATNELMLARERENQLDLIANVDALTRVRNKRAYDQECARLDEGIKCGRTKFGMAMIDLNDLKVLNDTYGHEKGDIGIKTVCSLICSIFQHSPVFRVGGDEFIVILENTDFEHADKLIAYFESSLSNIKQNSSLDPWKKVSAAIGYAVFDPECDQTADDVGKRADKKMYEYKKKQKEEMNGNKQ